MSPALELHAPLGLKPSLLLVTFSSHLPLSAPLQNKIILDPLTFSEARFRPSLEERLESIISGAALMADSSCTRDDRRERIVAECNAVRQALQDLLSEYMNNVSRPAPTSNPKSPQCDGSWAHPQVLFPPTAVAFTPWSP